MGSKGGARFRARLTRVFDAHVHLPTKEFLVDSGGPLVEHGLAMSFHKSNVYIGVSGWLAKYLTESVLQMANGRLSDRFLFGSDYPFLNPQRCVASLRERTWREGVLKKIPWSNASTLFR